MTIITRDGTARSRVRHAARAVVTQFGTLTAGFRLEPRFVIAGAQRCATTSVFRMLAQHPQVAQPMLNKGIHYFDTADRYARGASFYGGHFPLRRPWDADRVSGEASPYYIFHPRAIARIAADLPKAQVIVLLRDPVERAYSAYKQEFERGFETLTTFEEALDAEAERLEGEESRLLADAGYHSFAHQHHAYIGRGLYTRQLERARSELGDDRLIVVDLGALVSEPSAWDDMIARVGLSPWRPASMLRVNERQGSAMRPETRARLRDLFSQENADLAEFLGWTPSWCR